MKRLFVSFLFLLLFSVAAVKAADNPVADPNAVVVSGNMRFTVLTPEMIRIEWKSGDDKSFEDHATFAIINRRLPVPAYTTKEEDGFLYIETEKLKLQYRIGSFPGTFNPASSANLKITFDMDGKTVTWYPWKKDALNLKGTCRTLDSSNSDNKRSELENGLISRSGWAVIDDSETRSDGSKSLLFEPNDVAGFDWVKERDDKAGMDWYFMGYGHDYKKALYDFTRIAGRIPMPPLYALGYWYSKYQRYSEQDFKDLVNEMRNNNIPLDVMVVDTDWHINGWTGWSWNRELFPDPAEFLKWLHDADLKVTLNLHPAYGIASNEDNYAKFAAEAECTPDADGTIPWTLESPKFYKSLFDNILRPHENIGVDFWWLDWQQWLLSDKVDGLGHTYWINYVFYKDMQINHPDKRALIFHRWGGLGNHRYQVGFSGDSQSNFPTLAFQPYFTATASNVGYGYWGHDLGGHMETPWSNDPELYLRWIQYGVFSPLFRTHSTSTGNIERRIWKYPNYSLMKEAFELRYSLVPYIYTQARKAYDTGVSICRPLYYDYPEQAESYDYEKEYMFGDDILVRPITKPADSAKKSVIDVWLPEGGWYEACSGERLEGNAVYSRTFGQADIPYYYKEGAVVPNYPKIRNLKHRPDNLIVVFVPGKDGETKFYEDENDTEGYRDGKYTFTTISQEYNGTEATYTIYPAEGSFEGMPASRSYTIRLPYIDKPESVTVGGVAYDYSDRTESSTWTYDSKTRTAEISIPETGCDVQTVISVKHSNASVGKVGGAGFKMFYNKAKDAVCVSLPAEYPNVEVQVCDMSGAVVIGDKFCNVQMAESDASSLQKGIYLCKLTAGGKTITNKFVK